MKKLAAILLLLLGPVIPLFSQGTLRVGAGARIHFRNNAYILLRNMNLVNNGSITQAAGNGTARFTGGIHSGISGSGITTLDKMELAVTNGTTVTLSTTVRIRNTISIVSGQLISDGFLVLQSDSAYTARVAEITSAATNPVSGSIVAERYIKGRRKYRLMCSSVTTSTAAQLTNGQEALSIWGNWQNQGNNSTPNSGTIITGGTAADGFDQQVQTASMYTYDDSLRRFISFSTLKGKNTKYTPLKAGRPYYIFIYGDRTNTVASSEPNNTVVRETGILLTGDQAFSPGSAIPISTVSGRFSMLGNPYASAIDWATVEKTDIENTYWGWDPNLSSLGGFMTVNTSGNVTLISPYTGSTRLNQYIQAGQGFFVRTTGSSPVLTIREQDKVAGYVPLAFRNSSRSNDLPLLALNLYYSSGSGYELADGVLAAFDSTYSRQTGKEDAVKMENAGESLSLFNGTDNLSIDARKKPLQEDTLFLRMVRLSRATYRLQLFTSHLESDSLQPFLEDRYLNSVLPVSTRDTSYITFSNDPAVPASFAADRFRIVFKKVPLLPQTDILVSAIPINNTARLDWKSSNSSTVLRYEILKSKEAALFHKAGELIPSGINTNNQYSWLDEKPFAGINYYRIRAILPDGVQLLSNTVTLLIKTRPSLFNVYPNPVTNRQLQLAASEAEKGLYTLTLLNSNGQACFHSTFQHTGGTFNKVLALVNNLMPGIYYLRVAHPSLTLKIPVVIQ